MLPPSPLIFGLPISQVPFANRKWCASPRCPWTWGLVLYQKHVLPFGFIKAVRNYIRKSYAPFLYIVSQLKDTSSSRHFPQYVKHHILYKACFHILYNYMINFSAFSIFVSSAQLGQCTGDLFSFAPWGSISSRHSIITGRSSTIIRTFSISHRKRSWPPPFALRAEGEQTGWCSSEYCPPVWNPWPSTTRYLDLSVCQSRPYPYYSSSSAYFKTSGSYLTAGS